MISFYIRKDFTHYLKMKGWKISDLTKKLGMKSEQQVSQTLSGSIEPSMNFLHRLCDVTGFDLKDLVETKRVK